MEIEKLPTPVPEKKPEQSGQWLWKTLKPFGCILCLVLMVAMIVICFTAGTDPIPGYEPPHDSEYYAENVDELITELEANVFPHVEGLVSCEAVGGKAAVTIAEGSFAVTRSAILQYFDAGLFEFIKG